jgi:hypothetical protein
MDFMRRLTTSFGLAVTAGAVAALIGLAGAQAADRPLHNPFDGGKSYNRHHGSGTAPEFEVDASWPKPLPNNWIAGQVGGLTVDSHDHIWIIQRARTLTNDEAGATDAVDDNGDRITDADKNPIDELGNPRPYGPISGCCLPAPAVMEFDQDGNLLKAWGGPADPGFIGPHDPGTPGCDPDEGCYWPAGEHGIFVDHNDNVWISGNGNGTGGSPWASNNGYDSQVLKFSNDGTFLLHIGDPGNDHDTSNDTGTDDMGNPTTSNSTPQVWRAADIEVDPRTNEAYIADGYGNHRLLVVDADTGMYKRHWGAYGENPVDIVAADDQGDYAEDRDAGVTPQHFRNPVHCARVTRDRKVYVCDRINDRLQVFKTDGTFIAELFIKPETLSNGSVWDLDTSSDRFQSCLYNPDGTNQEVDTIDRRALDVIASFGSGGRNAGQFHWVHNLATDSEGNIYTGEVDTGKRAQKFVRSGADGCKGS